MATFRDLTAVQLRQAVHLREQIEELQAKLDALLGGTAPKAKPTKAGAKRSGVDAAPTWRFAHVRSPLDTLFDAAPERKSGPTAGRKAKSSAATKARWATKKASE